ncbi:MAG: universal stress protein [Bacteroidales bacterium]|jgi:nucleotide-binding universal stress UspA family protein|nr:universal stress protein [Bacteroidales bacterium]MDY0084905.1 universal stress protein [Bacteroidales bacterium]
MQTSVMNDPAIINIGTYTYSRALLIKVRLESEGIPCFLSQTSGSTSEVMLHVNESDLPDAQKYISLLAQASGTDKEKSIKLLRSVRRILVPIDFSDESEKAVRYALKLATFMKADIRLMHAWMPVAAEHFAWGEMYAMQTDIESQIRNAETEAEERLQLFQQELKLQIKRKKIKGVDVDFDLIRGNASEAISAVAHDYKPGLIVMGTKGKQRFERGFFGSTTLKAISKGKIPVLAIPPSYDESSFEQTKKLLYVTSFDTTDFDSLSRLMAFVRPFNARIYCLHVHQKGSMIVDETRMRTMREHFNQFYKGFQVECGLLESGDVLEGIEHFIQEHKIDVLALTAKKQNLLSQLFEPGLSRKLLFRSSIPLLVFGGVK